jgi:glycerol uptake facilitator-like aquaporin
LLGTIRTRDALLYVVAQIAGGCLGTICANVMFSLPVVALSTKVRSSGALWFSEVLATIGLLLVIHGCVRTGRANAVPFAVGIWIGGTSLRRRRVSPIPQPQSADPCRTRSRE